MDEGKVAVQIRQRLAALQSAWNRADVSAVISEYDTSFFAVVESNCHQERAQYLAQARQSLSGTDCYRIDLDVNAVRSLGPEHAMANGCVRASPVSGNVETARFFTVIYKRMDGEWKLIYAHT